MDPPTSCLTTPVGFKYATRTMITLQNSPQHNEDHELVDSDCQVDNFPSVHHHDTAEVVGHATRTFSPMFVSPCTMKEKEHGNSTESYHSEVEEFALEEPAELIPTIQNQRMQIVGGSLHSLPIDEGIEYDSELSENDRSIAGESTDFLDLLTVSLDEQRQQGEQQGGGLKKDSTSTSSHARWNSSASTSLPSLCSFGDLGQSWADDSFILNSSSYLESTFESSYVSVGDPVSEGPLSSTHHSQINRKHSNRGGEQSKKAAGKEAVDNIDGNSSSAQIGTVLECLTPTIQTNGYFVEHHQARRWTEEDQDCGPPSDKEDTDEEEQDQPRRIPNDTIPVRYERRKSGGHSPSAPENVGTEEFRDDPASTRVEQMLVKPERPGSMAHAFVSTAKSVTPTDSEDTDRHPALRRVAKDTIPVKYERRGSALTQYGSPQLALNVTTGQPREHSRGDTIPVHCERNGSFATPQVSVEASPVADPRPMTSGRKNQKDTIPTIASRRGSVPFSS